MTVREADSVAAPESCRPAVDGCVRGRAIDAGGPIPCPEGQGRGDEAVEVCRRHEPDPRTGIGGQESGRSRRDDADRVPRAAAVRRKLPVPFAVAAAVKAIPSTAAVSMSVIRSPPCACDQVGDQRSRVADLVFQNGAERHVAGIVEQRGVIDRVDRDRECLRCARIHSAVCGSPIVLESHCHDCRSIRVRRRGKREGARGANRRQDRKQGVVVCRDEEGEDLAIFIGWAASDPGRPSGHRLLHRHPRSRTGRRPSRSWAHR